MCVCVCIVCACVCVCVHVCVCVCVCVCVLGVMLSRFTYNRVGLVPRQRRDDGHSGEIRVEKAAGVGVGPGGQGHREELVLSGHAWR